MEVDFDKAYTDVGDVLSGSCTREQTIDKLMAVLSTLDAAKAEIARLTAEREAWKKAFDDLQAESNTQLARLAALNEQQDRAMKGVAGGRDHCLVRNYLHLAAAMKAAEEG